MRQAIDFYATRPSINCKHTPQTTAARSSGHYPAAPRSLITSEMADCISRNACSHSSVSSLYRGSPDAGPIRDSIIELLGNLIETNTVFF